jgi:hypothetical protein
VRSRHPTLPVTGKSDNNLYGADGKCRVRRKVSGRTKTEARDKLKTLHRQLDTGCGYQSSPRARPMAALIPSVSKETAKSPMCSSYTPGSTCPFTASSNM